MILFSFWRIDTVGGLVGSMLACMALGIIFEALRSLRDVLSASEWEERAKQHEADTETSTSRQRR